jgi:hypothetical protein
MRLGGERIVQSGNGHFFEEPMPFTAKLSRRFYDHFGDELTNEFVDLIKWMFLFFTGSALANVLLR